MAPTLPPHDPNESPLAEPADDLPFAAPTTIFSRGTPSAADQTLADALLAARPGVLFVIVR